MTNCTNIKDRVLHKLQQITAYMYSCDETESIIGIEKRYLNPCLYCIELCQAQRTPTPLNKHIEKQNFFSTKRKRQSSKIRLGKPSIEEKGKIAAALLQTTIPESKLSELTIATITNCHYCRYSLGCGGQTSCIQWVSN